MKNAIGIRLPKDILEKIKNLGEQEMEDRSTIIRKLLIIGYLDFMKKKSAEEYEKGSITLSEAAHRANLTLWEMEKFLIEQGFKSSYSLEDLEKEMKSLK